MKKIIIFLITILLLTGTAFAQDEIYSENISKQMRFFGYRDGDFRNLFDNNNETYFYLNMNRGENNIGFINESDSTITHVYIKWAAKPEQYIIQKSLDGNIYEDVLTVKSQFLNDLVQIEINPNEYFRIHVEQTLSERFAIDAIEVFDAGSSPLPSYVQDWDATVDKADLMIFSAHADDEWVFFGGAIPRFSVEEKKDTVVVYMAADKAYRKSEALCALWAGGLTTYPVFAPFKDYYTYQLDETMEVWGEDDTIKYCVRLIRQHKPDVVLTHEFNGEYGHGNHKMTAYAVDRAVILAQDASYDSQSADEYGVWEVKKLYIHLYEENMINVDYTAPLTAYGGLSAYDVSKTALQQNLSQLKYSGLVYVHEDEQYCCAQWGLRYSSVGPDVIKDSFFENVVKQTPTPEPTSTMTPSPIPTATIAPTSTPQSTAQEPTMVQQTQAESTDESESGVPIWLVIYSIAATIALIAVLVLYMVKREKE